jgi:hypothetical protein
MPLISPFANISAANAPIAAFRFRRYVCARSIAYVGAIITEKAR